MLEAMATRSLEQLKEKLKGKTGQQVLAVSQEERCAEMCHGMGDSDCSGHSMNIETALRLGILTAEPRQADSGGLDIPTERHAYKGGHFRTKWELREGTIYVSFSDMASLGRTIRGRRRGNDYQTGFNIYTGEEVAEYFRRGGMTEKEFEHHQRWERRSPMDRSYAYALRLLGQPLPEDFNKAEEADKQKEIDSLINALLSEKDVERNLQKAFELGLHRKPRIEPLRRGITADVPEYIRGLCERYKIEVPQ